MLLFSAGVETHMGELDEVKGTAAKVGIMGAVLPFVAGLAVAFLFDYPLDERLFVATTLMATSVGITVRVLEELGFHKRKSARIILAAAVIDDILGLFVLHVGSDRSRRDRSRATSSLPSRPPRTWPSSCSSGRGAINRLRRRLARISATVLLEIAIIAMLGSHCSPSTIGLAAIVGRLPGRHHRGRDEAASPRSRRRSSRWRGSSSPSSSSRGRVRRLQRVHQHAGAARDHRLQRRAIVSKYAGSSPGQAAGQPRGPRGRCGHDPARRSGHRGGRHRPGDTG